MHVMTITRRGRLIVIPAVHRTPPRRAAQRDPFGAVGSPRAHRGWLPRVHKVTLLAFLSFLSCVAFLVIFCCHPPYHHACTHTSFCCCVCVCLCSAGRSGTRTSVWDCTSATYTTQIWATGMAGHPSNTSQGRHTSPSGGHAGRASQADTISALGARTARTLPAARGLSGKMFPHLLNFYSC
jgi:hypothetical protein